MDEVPIEILHDVEMTKGRVKALEVAVAILLAKVVEYAPTREEAEDLKDWARAFPLTIDLTWSPEDSPSFHKGALHTANWISAQIEVVTPDQGDRTSADDD